MVDRDKSEESNGPASFLRRLRQNVTDTVSRPVPGLVKINPSVAVASSAVTGFLSSTFRGGNNTNSTSSHTKEKDQSLMKESGFPNVGVPVGGKSPLVTPAYRISQFELLLTADNIDLHSLRKLSWNGIPSQFRTMTWQLMLGYLPTNKARREIAIARKRKEYRDSVVMYYDVADSDRTTQEGEILRQILVDIPRTSPHSPLYQQKPIQKCMERILYIWSIRHPASGYVQGMNDLVTPLIYISLAPFVNGDAMRYDVGTLDANTLWDIEADSYWCLTKLLDNIQDHYTFSQPGLQRMVLRGLSPPSRCSPPRSFPGRRHSIHAIQLSMDELSTSSRAPYASHNPVMGHLLRRRKRWIW
jgi:Rab-GTPase-TBC domain